MMPGLVESAEGILRSSERRLEVVSGNVSNISTPGYKKQITFSQVVTDGYGASYVDDAKNSEISQAELIKSGNSLDLAISGYGFFRVRSGLEMFYTREGHFQLASDATVITSQGYVLQQADGGDLTIDRDEIEILADGTILDGERPVGRVGVFAPTPGAKMVPISGSLFAASESAMEQAVSVHLRQGMLEGSNVTLGEEMVTMMTALRQAETGARLVQVYDDLIGRAITTFGQGAR